MNKKNGGEIMSLTICELLNQVTEVLSNPIREKILIALPPGALKTFDELKAETGISTGGLHHQLDLLKQGEYVSKTIDRPALWSRTQKFDLLIARATKGLQDSCLSKDNLTVGNIPKIPIPDKQNHLVDAEA
jgi:hypothetical protein